MCGIKEVEERLYLLKLGIGIYRIYYSYVRIELE